MRRIFFICLITGIFLGCGTTAKVIPANSIKISGREAGELAKEFAAKESFGEEFIITKARKIKKYMILGKNPHWIWQVYFASQGHSALKFYKNTFLMVEVNAADGAIENWGRR